MKKKEESKQSMMNQMGKTIITNNTIQKIMNQKDIMSYLFGFSFLKPYLGNVTGTEIRKRLLTTFIPQKNMKTQKYEMNMNRICISPDIYGPLFSVLSFVINLLFVYRGKTGRNNYPNFKGNPLEGQQVSLGIAMSFSYWIITTILYYILCVIFDTKMTLMQVFVIIGYHYFPSTILLFTQVFMNTLYYQIALVIIYLPAMIIFTNTFRLQTLQKKNGYIIMAILIVIQIGVQMSIPIWINKISSAGF
mmetsp:Transcript_5481/g.8098  ORF Transcript_5481/g.8098 Transcript_5481/m.8098 type:complete len:248 (+) Transcript_5481:36-779(+)